jgi:hypothetical protein
MLKDATISAKQSCGANLTGKVCYHGGTPLSTSWEGIFQQRLDDPQWQKCDLMILA